MTPAEFYLSFDALVHLQISTEYLSKSCRTVGWMPCPRGPPRRVSAYEISKSTGFQVDFGFQNGFLDFKVDFGFQNGFLDFKVDFSRDFWISFEPLLLKIQLKYTHDSSTAFLSACMLTEYKVTGTSPLHSAQAACSLIVIHIRLL